ncbi:MAG: long-chain fatty acid--CoA ligase [Pelagibacteraceae bacterium]|nr:long-chain fatty acid--CoA ligase [Pelagibacteraceae bacterium]PPR10877.1 MAG: 3-methylmercaptopropionyl-CoA ligase [Alphaproteobacteria bacterium MarineAlpha11_Bin1]
MLGLMMDKPLLISSVLEYAAKYHGGTEIVSRMVEGPIHRYNYADAQVRSKRLAKSLTRLGIAPGDRVATLAWNGFRHLELYYGVSGMGAICHMVNPRLFSGQISYILENAEDKIVFADLTFVPLLEGIAAEATSVKAFVIMTDETNMPDTSLPNVYCYEKLLAAEDGNYDWPQFDENTASSMCYSSGTTGNPKGVLYSHRSTVLHAWAAMTPDMLNISATDAIMPAVPMFHVNAWGIPYAAAMAGAKMVMPGAEMDGESIHRMIEDEGVTISAGVPTVWLGLLDYLDRSGNTVEKFKYCVIGGSAAPRAMSVDMHEKYGVQVLHAWGMTEMSPLGTVNWPKNGMEGETDEARYDRQVKQGRPCYGIDMKIVNDANDPLPEDGKSFGELKVRGFWVCSEYYRAEGASHDSEGWFPTGDVATIDSDGYMHVTDRSKDVIKSGGEWISSIELENIAIGHPGVFEAAVIGVSHPKWDERPLLIVVRNEGSDVSAEDLLAFYEGKVAKWWIPDDVAFIDELPHTATGKLLKMDLRNIFEGYKLPKA